MDPNLRPEKQHATPKQGRSEKLWVGQGKAGLRRRRSDHINQPSDVTPGIPGGSKIETGKTNSSQGTNSACDRAINNNNPFLPDVPLHLDLLHKTSSLHQNTNKINHNPDINLDFEENSPFQEGVISETIQSPDKSFFQTPKELEDLIDKGNLIHRFLPKQTDIDKILQIIQRKVLKGTHLPVEVKEIQAGYLQSLYFKDIYQYLLQNKLPSSKLAIKKLEALSEKYVLFRFFIVQNLPRKRDSSSGNTRNVCRQDNNSVSQSLFAGHQGVIKTYFTISDKFFIPNLIHYFRSYIKGCHIYQLSRNEKPTTRHHQTRIIPNYVPMSRLSMDLKVMPRLDKGHRYVLCIIDEVTNFSGYGTNFSSKVRRGRIGTFRTCHNKILHTGIYNNGSRQCIHVLIDDLSLT